MQTVFMIRNPLYVLGSTRADKLSNESLITSMCYEFTAILMKLILHCVKTMSQFQGDTFQVVSHLAQ